MKSDADAVVLDVVSAVATSNVKCSTTTLAVPHFLMTEYQAIPDGKGTFAVKITFASGHSRLQPDFRTEVDAKSWIETQMERDAKKFPARP